MREPLSYEPDGDGYKIRIRSDNAESPRWIRVVRSDLGGWEVVDDSMTLQGGDWATDATSLGFSEWDDDVENLDLDSDEWQCFGISGKLRSGGIILFPDHFEGGAIDEVAAALSRVSYCSYCRGDV
jgi:hypothetical protein